MKELIIGLSGKANSGKDTVASMISYIMQVGVTKAKYSEWDIYSKAIKNKYVDKCKKTIIHFADSLKDCLSIIYNIPRDYFDDRHIKDKMYFSIDEHRLLDPKDLLNYHTIINNVDLQIKSINEIRNSNKDKKIVLTLRTLMQYFGTDICRKTFGENVWVDSTMRKAGDIILNENYCIIADVRFKNESDAIKRSAYFGALIKINRNDIFEYDHESENCNVNYTHIIDNNGSLMSLFYNLLDIIYSII